MPKTSGVLSKLLEWPTYDSAGGGMEMRFNQSFTELIVSTDVDTPH